MAKKTYTIKIKREYARLLLRELNAWGIKESQYEIALITQNTNVVDVVMETFYGDERYYEIDVA